MFCPECGKTVEHGVAFCPDCGAKVGETLQVVSPVSQTIKRPLGVVFIGIVIYLAKVMVWSEGLAE